VRISSLVKAVVLTMVLVYPSASGAQTVTPADAQAFMGTWAINVDTPGGPTTVDLTVTEEAGEVTAEIGGGTTGNPMGGVNEMTKNGSSLVLKYEANAQGAVTPITLTLEADGDELAANFDVGGQVLPGKGTRK
jgi:hypothetical protein